MTRNKEIVQGIYRALSVGDIAGAFTNIDDHVAWIEAAGFPYGGTYRGRADVEAGVFKKLASEWEGWSAVPADFIADGQTVVVLGQYSGSYRATGKSFTAPYVHVWKLGCEKVVSFAQHTDTLLVDEAMKAG
jgi:hypothetical protein